MFAHNKRLQYTVRVSEPNPGLANLRCWIIQLTPPFLTLAIRN
ncbi:hypothetical protein [Massilia phosphatilytica]